MPALLSSALFLSFLTSWGILRLMYSAQPPYSLLRETRIFCSLWLCRGPLHVTGAVSMLNEFYCSAAKLEQKGSNGVKMELFHQREPSAGGTVWAGLRSCFEEVSILAPGLHGIKASDSPLPWGNTARRTSYTAKDDLFPGMWLTWGEGQRNIHRGPRIPNPWGGSSDNQTTSPLGSNMI